MTPLLLGLALAFAAPGLKDPPPKGPPPLVGEWAVQGIIVDGTPKPLPSGTTWTFTADGKAALRVGRAKAADEGTYTTNPKKVPAEMDIHLGPGTNLRAVYRLDGDELTVCYTVGGARPGGFDAPTGSKAVLWTLKRVPKKE